MVSDVFVEPRMGLTPAFARTWRKEEDSLEGQVLQGSLFKVSKGNICELVKYQRKVRIGDASATPAFARTRRKEEDSLEGQVLQGSLFKVSKGNICELVKYQRKVQIGDTSATLKSL